jgi:[protein-PII] uridylyltransferase
MTQETLARSVADIRRRFFLDPWGVYPEIELADLLDRELTGRLTRVLDVASGWAVLAAGGYGRRTLHPGSDLDLLVLFDGLADPTRVPVLLDALGDPQFEVGYQVRRMADFASFDPAEVDSVTAFLEVRHLWGDPATSSRLSEQVLPRFLRTHREPLLRAIVAAQDRRHVQAGEGERSEPDVKNGIGGLRDYHTIRWIAGVTGLERPSGSDGAAVFLRRIRNLLHFLSDSGEDVLRARYQSPIASLLGFGEDGADRLLAECRERAGVLVRCGQELRGNLGLIGKPPGPGRG